MTLRQSLDRLIFRGAERLLSAAARDRFAILAYHRVLPVPDPLRDYDIDATAFETIVATLAEHFHVLPLTEALSHARRGSLPPRTVCITFDDGYADNFEVAYDVLRRWNLHATFFVTSQYLHGGVMWNDAIIEAVRQAPASELDLTALGLGRQPLASVKERAATAMKLILQLRYLEPGERQRQVDAICGRLGTRLPTLMLSPAQVRALHDGGMAIGGHTVTHPILARLSPEQAWREIAQGKEELEAIVAAPVDVFAYPNGRPGTDYRAEHVAMVRRAGFSAAVSTAWGAARASDDVYQLPRIMPWQRTALGFGLRVLGSFRSAAMVAAA